MYRPIRTMNTAGAIIPINGTKTPGSKLVANSLDIAYMNRSTVTLKIVYQLEPLKVHW